MEGDGKGDDGVQDSSPLHIMCTPTLQINLHQVQLYIRLASYLRVTLQDLRKCASNGEYTNLNCDQYESSDLTLVGFSPVSRSPPFREAIMALMLG